MTSSKLIWVFLASGLGGSCRYFLSDQMKSIWPSNYPFATLAVNVLACFIAGYFVSRENPFGHSEIPIQTIVLIGFCGGFSTFSAFATETVQLLQRGHFFTALSYIILSITLGLLAFALPSKI